MIKRLSNGACVLRFNRIHTELYLPSTQSSKSAFDKIFWDLLTKHLYRVLYKLLIKVKQRLPWATKLRPKCNLCCFSVKKLSFNKNSSALVIPISPWIQIWGVWIPSSSIPCTKCFYSLRLGDVSNNFIRASSKFQGESNWDFSKNAELFSESFKDKKNQHETLPHML